MKAFFRLGKAAVDEIATAARKTPGTPVATVKLLAPIANPGKLLAVAGGYYTHAGDTRLRPDAISTRRPGCSAAPSCARDCGVTS